MPGTPSVREDAVAHDADFETSIHSSCPPEELCDDSWMQTQIRLSADEAEIGQTTIYMTPPSVPSRGADAPTPTARTSNEDKMDIGMVEGTDGVINPASVVPKSEEKREKVALRSQSENSVAVSSGSYARDSISEGYEFSNGRLQLNCPSSFMRPGSKFVGTQTSERQKYDVQVDIKMVDMKESYMCGFLRIQGLTEDHPTLTTFFEGEIIGPKYSFHTNHGEWGSTNDSDFEHWSKFPPFKRWEDNCRRGKGMPDPSQKENVFMRWKEHFLVPDHRVKTITGASFEGFYYICFNQIRGKVEGIYFHSKSERYQRLELDHVEDRGTYPAVELR